MAVSKISWLLPPSKLKLAINDVHVWRVRLNQTDGRVQQLQQNLSDDEQLRAVRGPKIKHSIRNNCWGGLTLRGL